MEGQVLASILKPAVGFIGACAVLALVIWLNQSHERRLRREGRVSRDPLDARDGTNFLEQVGFTVIVLGAVGLVLFVVSRVP